jgi:HlyD family secretion protein
MPAEAHLQTHMRTVLSYLAKPLTDQFARAFRED